MGLETISEPTFLLTELRYTLGQLHVQVLDLDPNTRHTAMCGDRSIEQVLHDMVTAETRWQTRYREILHASTAETVENIAVPLPINEADEESSTENTFEHMRAETIAMLEAAGEAWTQELIDAVKQQIGNDRRLTTDIAECRKSYFSHDHRPDLSEPLTEQSAPHVRSEETVASEPIN